MTLVPLLALAFAVASFWWLWLRKGRLRSVPPRVYAGFFRGQDVALRLPLALYNTGPTPILVADLRVMVGEHVLEWDATRSTIRPDPKDWVDFAAPFAVPGRGVLVVFAEFRQQPARWCPDAMSRHLVRVEWLDREGSWVELITFDWWAPEQEDTMGAYIAHRNEEVGGPLP